MPIHRERYRRREDGVDLLGRAWIVIAANGLRSLARRRAFLFLMILAWIPAIVRAVQIYAAANVPSVAQIGFLADHGPDVPRFSEPAGTVRLFHYGLRGLGADRR